MKKYSVCLLLSLLIHAAVFIAFPFFNYSPKKREYIIVSIDPVPSRKVESVSPKVSSKSAGSGKVDKPADTAKPTAEKPKEKTEEKPAEVKPAEKPVQTAPTANSSNNQGKSVGSDKPNAENILDLPEKGEEEFPVSDEQGQSTIEGDNAQDKNNGISIAAPGGVDTKSGEETVENSGSEKAAEETPEPRDGRADVAIVQTFVGDRIQGQIEFKGKGRKLVSTPSAPDFKLSNNTTVTVDFKIDQYGATYDISIPPLSRDIEVMLRDFVRKMRFSAVLYDEADQASMRITLTVR